MKYTVEHKGMLMTITWGPEPMSAADAEKQQEEVKTIMQETGCVYAQAVNEYIRRKKAFDPSMALVPSGN